MLVGRSLGQVSTITMCVSGFADEALSALEAQTQENGRLRQQIAAVAPTPSTPTPITPTPTTPKPALELGS